MTPELQAAAERRTTIARHLAEADVALDAINGDFVHDMGLYSAIQAIKALRYAVARIADELAALDPTDVPIDRIPTPRGIDYLRDRRQQHPHGTEQ